MTPRTEEVDWAQLAEEELASIVTAVNVLDAEAKPRHVELSTDELRMFANSPGMVQRRFVVSDSGEIAALGAFRYPDDGTSPDTLTCSIRVLPGQRRRGIGTSLLGRAVEIADDSGRGTLQGFIFDTVPAGGEFVEAIGGEKKMDHHENVLRIADLDRSLMESWIALGEQRSPGYSVRVFDGLWPAELLDDIAHLFFVLERDMPMSDSFEPSEWDAQRVRELQDHYAEGVDSLTAIAIEEETGTAVGMSDIVRRKLDPSTWMVTTTMVDPEHRGKALGKWVKGAVNVAALDRWEDGIYQETGNAFVNEPMLAINHAMGFEHELTLTDCSVSTDAARAFVESRQ